MSHVARTVGLLAVAGLAAGGGFLAGRATRPEGEEPRLSGAAQELEDLSGRWRAARQTARDSGTDLQHGEVDDLEQSILAGLGYAEGTHTADADRPVVPQFDEQRAQPGVNFLTSGHAPIALLIGMDGRVLHRWERTVSEVWPDEFSGELADDGTQNWNFFRRARLFPNGDILAIFSGAGIIRLNAASEVTWARRGRFHHEFDLDAEGRIYALNREQRIIPRINRKLPLLEDFVTVLSSDGEELQHVSLLECFDNSNYRGVLDFIPVGADIFHTNSIKALDDTLRERHPAFRSGNVLVSLRQTNTLAVVDLENKTIPWALSGNWRRQHDPTVLPTGNMLVFDNLPDLDYSRALEFDPFTQAKVWEFVGSEDTPLLTRTCGAATRLANGNTLLTESDHGRAIEITSDGEVVWEFISPFRAGDEGELVATLFEVERYPLDFLDEGALAGR